MNRSLSIVIPSHSQTELLRRCLRAVCTHAPLATQIIVVDDGSPREIVSRIAREYEGVEILRNETAQGFCAAVNRGIEAARGEIIELLNDDAEVTAGWADAILPWFDADPIAAVTPLVLQDRGSRQSMLIDTAGDEYDRGGFARKRGHGERFDPHGPYGKPGRVWGVSAAAAFYRRDVLRRIGSFPVAFGAYFDDVDVSFRLRRAGFECGYEPQAIVWHRVSASYDRLVRPETVRMQSRNEELVFWRNVQGRERVRNLARHGAVLFGKAIRRSREGTLSAWLAGRCDAWRLLCAKSVHDLQGERAEGKFP